MIRKTRILGVLAVLGFLSACTLLFANVRVSASSGTSMVATFRDDTTIPDRIRSDGGGAYVNGQQDIKAIIDGVGDFDFDTSANGAAQRTLFLDFTDPSSPGATPPFSTANVDVYLSTGGGGLLQMTVGSAKAMHLHINLPGSYFLDFNPLAQPGSSTVTVTRTSSNTWTIEAASTSIAKLTKVTTVHGKTTITNEGFFFMPFKLTAQEH